MEQFGTDIYVNWIDWRAFGYLEPGTVVMIPVSSKESIQQGFGYHTSGNHLPGTASTSYWTVQPCSSLGDPATVWAAIGCVDYVAVERLPRRAQF
jgi:hypothetical protein